MSTINTTTTTTTSSADMKKDENLNKSIGSSSEIKNDELKSSGMKIKETTATTRRNDP